MKRNIITEATKVMRFNLLGKIITYLTSKHFCFMLVFSKYKSKKMLNVESPRGGKEK